MIKNRTVWKSMIRLSILLVIGVVLSALARRLPPLSLPFSRSESEGGR